MTVKKKKRPKTARAGGPVRRKKKRVKRPRDLDKQMDNLQAEEDKITPAMRVQSGTRGFKISFGGLPSQKKIPDSKTGQLNKADAKIRKSMLRQSTALFEKHPKITAMNSAKNKVLALFHARTLPFTEPGVRLFILETKDIDFDNLSEEEIDQAFARQLDNFLAEMREVIDEYGRAVRDLRNDWSDVLKEAEEALGDFFDPDYYPPPESLESKLECRLRPYNSELPKEYGWMSASERNRAISAIRAQYEEAVAKQEEFVVSLLHDAIDQMIDSISGYHRKDQKTFKNSVVERVFDAFDEFQQKTLKFGILKGTALQKEFERAKEFMTEGSVDRETLPGLLRQSGARREDLVEKMNMVKDSIGRLAEKKRRVIVD